MHKGSKRIMKVMKHCSTLFHSCLPNFTWMVQAELFMDYRIRTYPYRMTSLWVSTFSGLLRSRRAGPVWLRKSSPQHPTYRWQSFGASTWKNSQDRAGPASCFAALSVDVSSAFNGVENPYAAKNHQIIPNHPRKIIPHIPKPS